jgi:mannose/fructose/N-acetylgalactosamine-specific phosphotransferase system component IID
MEKKSIKFGILGGIGEAIYCALIALMFFTFGKIFNGQNGDTVTTFLIMLLILVISVAVSGFLVFGYPAYLVYQKRFKEGIYTALISLATLFVAFSIVVLINLLVFKL